ncbi:hypothetical protein RhiirA4_16124 [Rhizophagus irregularis]|uniref:Uncharacterized protein n=1 Tax=Rhizophagus irregularis TaxID=588596 RepID=A0A2I1GZH2_9GLOM|nr:hypothetical protein RhiirA4_16124 [Rhizophagus irregularis]
MQRKRNNLQGFFSSFHLHYNTVLAHYYYKEEKKKKGFKESYKYVIQRKSRNANRKRKTFQNFSEIFIPPASIAKRILFTHFLLIFLLQCWMNDIYLHTLK